MKFDFVIGNPPYQEEVDNKSKVNGQAPRTNIFQYFQIEADKITKNSSVMIYPGGRWIHQFGKGCKEFGKDQLNDSTLKSIDFYPNSKELFGQSADLADGISIVVKNKEKKEEGFEYNYINSNEKISVHFNNPGSDLIPLYPKNYEITTKVDNYVKDKNLGYIHDRVLPRTLFGIESDFVEKNQDKVRLYDEDENIDFDKEVKVLTNDKAGKSGRAKWYVTSSGNLAGKEQYISEWQVAVSSANAGGQKRDNQIEIIDNHSGFGRSRVALASFRTEQEARNFFKYCNSKLIRFLFLMTDESLTSLGKKVIDVMDYSDHSFIDFSVSIDEQLFSFIGLNEDEQKYICDVISEIDRKRGKEK